MSSNRKKAKYALGLMSGTSADGVSIAAITVKPFRVVACQTYGYPAALRDKIMGAGGLDARGLSRLDFALGILFARKTMLFLKRFGLKPSDIAVIGSHGQTVCHHPGDNPPHTMQIGEPSFLAEAVGAPVVSDFRARDMAAGGEGAPLVPFLDQYLFGGGTPRLLQNIGGIGNVSLVGRGVRALGFDTGPGNCLMDDAVRLFTKGGMAYDRGGRFAAAGRADAELVGKWLKMPFFARKPPKSLDRAQFGPDFIAAGFGKLSSSNIKDVLATLNLFTAAAIAYAVRRHIPASAKPAEMIASGGGALNPVLMDNISRCMAPVPVLRSSARGLDELAKEPACFALLAHMAACGRINHCPLSTGARHARVLGKITPA